MANQNQNKVLKLGLVKGEYTVPLDGYVLDEEIEDFDLHTIIYRMFCAMENILLDHIDRNLDELPPYQYYSDVGLYIFINKFTPQTTPEALEILKWCVTWNVPCCFWYDNCQRGTYAPETLLR